MEDPTPRVNFETMQRFIGRTVLLACSVSQIEGNRLQAKTSDGAVVSIVAGSSPYEGQFIEVLGKVLDPNTLQELDHTNLGDNYSELARPLWRWRALGVGVGAGGPARS